MQYGQTAKYALGVFALSCLLTTVAAAGVTTEQGWRIRANGFWVDGGEVDRTEARDQGYRSDDAGAGVGVNGEYRFAPRLGVEGGLMAGARTDLEFVASTGSGSMFLASDTLGMTALCTGLNIHLAPDTRADFYLGPMIAYIDYGEISSAVFGPDFVGADGFFARVDFDNQMAFGANLGLDMPLGGRGWLFNANVRYLDSKLEGVEPGPRQTSDHDPLFVGVGFGYRF